MKTLLNDLGQDTHILLNLDATAAKGILDRQGIAKVRHIDVNVLWLQEQCPRTVVPLVHVEGELDNPVGHPGATRPTSVASAEHVGILDIRVGAVGHCEHVVDRDGQKKGKRERKVFGMAKALPCLIRVVQAPWAIASYYFAGW